MYLQEEGAALRGLNPQRFPFAPACKSACKQTESLPHPMQLCCLIICFVFSLTSRPHSQQAHQHWNQHFSKPLTQQKWWHKCTCCWRIAVFESTSFTSLLLISDHCTYWNYCNSMCDCMREASRYWALHTDPSPRPLLSHRCPCLLANGGRRVWNLPRSECCSQGQARAGKSILAEPTSSQICFFINVFLVVIHILFYINSGFLKILFILFLGRGEGREKEWERNISVWLSLVHPQLETWPAT